jgi:hypothetical protein
METITWKNSDLSGKRFDFETNTELLGTLTVLSELSSNALFTTDNDRLQFSRVGFLDNKVLIKKNGQLIGEIKNRLLGQTYIELKNGNKFRLSSNLFGRNLKWLGASSTNDDKEILLSAGLIAGRFNAYRLTFGIMTLGLLLYAASKIIG